VGGADSTGLGLGTLPLVDLPETVLLVLQPYAVEA
jgi:hypothetical protein